VDLKFCMANVAHPDAWVNIARGRGILEVFCHPGTQLADQEKPGSCQRSAELEFLMSPRMGELLAAAGSRLVNYWSV
jgi:predicted glycoside hydrolase/deacetylase ChbG (UPF0249 family)